jgi:hypothetical protein
MKYLLGLLMATGLILMLVTPVNAQVVVYTDPGWNGRWDQFSTDIFDLHKFKLSKNISSCWVDSGWRAYFYAETYFGGEPYVVDGPAYVTDFKCCGWNNKIRSIYLERLHNDEWVRDSGRNPEVSQPACECKNRRSTFPF